MDNINNSPYAAFLEDSIRTIFKNEPEPLKKIGHMDEFDTFLKALRGLADG